MAGSEEGLEAWEIEALRAAENRFNSTPDERHRFSDFVELARAQIRGTWFTIHEATEEAPSSYPGSALLVHSEKERLAFLCDVCMRVWVIDFPEVIGFLEDTTNGKLSPDEAQWLADSFGLDDCGDGFRVGFSAGGFAPAFVSRDLVLDFLILIAESFAQLESRHRLEFDPTQAKVRLKNLRNLMVPGQPSHRRPARETEPI